MALQSLLWGVWAGTDRPLVPRPGKPKCQLTEVRVNTGSVGQGTVRIWSGYCATAECRAQKAAASSIAQ